MADIIDEDPSSGLQTSEEEEEDEVPVESLVKGRAKRSTAGLHMSALLEAAADDDLALLFEEVEDDNEFADELDPDAEDELLESSDEDEDQGPNAQNDYEGEQKLQKEERRKRKTQNDLRFQTLRKRVKIDPTAPSAMSAAPRPKKKSERISWIPTLEDGATRQSSRRQTMVNKELTHARLKDSQEKRVRIIATMKEAEKRKAHLKPKQMTQEDHLAEAARVERLNSKSLNRWELSEKRKADERRARIEALQNRRLDGPVISYWSGVATWTNGRLTRVGKVDIKPKPDKEDSKKRKKEKEEKEKAAAEAKLGSAIIAAPAPTVPPASFETEVKPASTASALPNSNSIVDQKPLEDKPSSDNTAAVTAAQKTTTMSPAAQSVGQLATGPSDTIATKKLPADQPVKQDEDNTVERQTSEVDARTTVPPSEEDKTKTKANDEQTSEPSKSSESRMFAVELPAPRHLTHTAGNGAAKVLPDRPSTKDGDAMDVDSVPVTAATTDSVKGIQEDSASKDPEAEITPSATGVQPHAADPPAPESAGLTVQEPQAAQAVSESRPLESATSVAPGVTADPQAPQAAITPNQAAAPANALHPNLAQPSPSQPESQIPNEAPKGPEPPEVPPPPPVIEHTGRSLTILENFDYATANNRKYSMYFNAKKPARLTKISSSLCVITSLPSRYRDPETALPYANSYAYGQIRRLLSDGYIWSSMLGCFVGPAEAARGVPERFTGKPGPGTVRYPIDQDEGQVASITGHGINQAASNVSTPSHPTPAASSAPPAEPMEDNKA